MRLAIVNANVWENDVDTVIIKNGKIVAVGYESALTKELAGCQVIDAEGNSLLPGLHDSHSHVFPLRSNYLDLRGVKSISELQELLRKAVNKGAIFLFGRGWDHEAFKEKRLPTRWDIDDITGSVPVVLVRICGHIALINSAMMKLLESRGLIKLIDPYLLKDNGLPTGLVIEDGINHVLSALPKPSASEIKENIIKLLRSYLSVGVTHVNFMSVSKELARAIDDALNSVNVNVGIYYEPCVISQQVPKLKHAAFCGVKDFADGSFGCRTAFLSEPYVGSNDRGKLLLTKAKFLTLAKWAGETGKQVAIHAIGDAAIEKVIEYANEAKIPPQMLRIEHASLSPPEILDKLSELRPHIVVQPHFLVSDEWLEEVIGEERVRWVYPFKSMIDSSLTLYGSSDYPVEPLNPFLSMSAATSRGLLQKHTYGQSLTKQEAINIYLHDPCLGSSSIREGSDANMVLLDTDLRKISGYDLASVRPKLVIVSGKITYFANNSINERC